MSKKINGCNLTKELREIVIDRYIRCYDKKPYLCTARRLDYLQDCDITRNILYLYYIFDSIDQWIYYSEFYINVKKKTLINGCCSNPFFNRDIINDKKMFYEFYDFRRFVFDFGSGII